jgi:hypothetical protein
MVYRPPSAALIPIKGLEPPRALAGRLTMINASMERGFRMQLAGSNKRCRDFAAGSDESIRSEPSPGAAVKNLKRATVGFGTVGPDQER